MSKKLSKAQKVVLNKMNSGQWYTAYDLNCSLTTLESLANRKILEMKSGLGSMFSPRTEIYFRKKENT